SAITYIDSNPKKALLFLDLIPVPVAANVKGRVAEYYKTKGLVNDRLNQEAQKFQNFLLALKYAKIEKNYDIAGMASLELFYNSFILNKEDKTAYRYLEEAKKYYNLSKNEYGLAEVLQMPAYVELFKKNYNKSNQLILQNLNTFKEIEEDQYYYMYALFMLASNNVNMYQLDQAHKYLQLLEDLKGNKTISKSLHASHIVTLYNSFAKKHLENELQDSTVFYLEKAKSMRSSMNSTDVKNYFTLKSNYYQSISNFNKQKIYLDSLQWLHQEKLKKATNATLEINKELQLTEKQLELETKKRNRNRTYLIVLLSAFFALVVFVILRYKLIKQKFNKFIKREKELSFLQTNHEKLKAKVKGLEDYIADVKKEIKTISATNDIKEQKTKIVALYKNIHHHSTTLLNKSDLHLELISELNVDFFNQINSKHTQLNDSEIIICYYIFTGFKNKQIAVFLNSTERAVESKRYRISKKLGLQEKGITLLDYLNQFYNS
ncbi:MAG: helix-turn-helix transcriptional regulator, partial [Oceanihabitans sp.]